MVQNNQRYDHHTRQRRCQDRKACLPFTSLQKSSRRTLIKRGMAVSALLTGGILLAGCEFFPQTSNQVSTDKHLLSSTPWQGFNFAWLPDSTQIACASDQGLFVVDRQTGQQMWKQKIWPRYDYKYVQAVTWSADGTRLAYVGSTALLVQDAPTGENLWTYQSDHSLTAALSPDGKRITFAESLAPGNLTDAGMQVWDLQEKRLITRYTQQESNKKPGQISRIVWSPDSAYIASTSQEGSVHIWQTADGHLLWAYSGQNLISPREAISWSPDGRYLAFLAIGERGQALLGVWDVKSGQVHFQTPANVGYPLKDDRGGIPLAWSPDSTRLAFEAQDREGPVIEVWSVQEARRLFTCQRVSGQPTNVTWSPDGRYLAAGNAILSFGEKVDGNNGDQSVIQFWNADNGSSLFSYSAPKSPDHLSWSPDSHYLAIITPKVYGILPGKTCLSMCRYGYDDYTLEIFAVKRV